MDYSPFIKEYLQKEIQVLESLDTEAVNRALGLLAENGVPIPPDALSIHRC